MSAIVTSFVAPLVIVGLLLVVVAWEVTRFPDAAEAVARRERRQQRAAARGSRLAAAQAKRHAPYDPNVEARKAGSLG